MILAHSLVGFPITYLILRFFPEVKNLTKFQINFLYMVGVVSAVLPDFDLLYSYFFHDINHRYYITHSFFLYILFFILFYLFSRVAKKNKFFLFLISIIFITSVSSHLILDFYVGGIVLVAPWSYQLYGYEIQASNTNFWTSYFVSIYMFYEFLAVVPFVWLVSNLKFKKIPINYVGFYLSLFFFILACFMAVVFFLR